MDTLEADHDTREQKTFGGTGQSAPQHHAGIGWPVLRRANRADARLEHPVLHAALAFDSVDNTDNKCHLNPTDGVNEGGNAMPGHRSTPSHSESVYRDLGLGQSEPDRESRAEPEGRGASR